MERFIGCVFWEESGQLDLWAPMQMTGLFHQV